VVLAAPEAWYPRWQLILYAIALLLPTLAILGFFEGGRQVMALAEDPAWIAQLAQEHPRARYKPEEIVAKLRQVDVLVSQEEHGGRNPPDRRERTCREGLAFALVFGGDLDLVADLRGSPGSRDAQPERGRVR
jgi:hypothetical protein